MRIIAIFILSATFLIHTSYSNGQSLDKGQISGKVIDSLTRIPVGSATIGVYKEGSTIPVSGGVTDVKGNFKINKLPFGNYQIVLDFVGFQSKIIHQIHLINGAKSTMEVSLGELLLSPSVTQLQNVIVESKRLTVENKIDKLVYNPSNDLSAQGGVALDVLKKVPQVSVDIDGKVELQGNSNIRFLINGKPSAIFGASLTDALQSIPASQIQSIEVITMPGAKYDASGTGGIINILLKDNKINGVNGNINLSAGTRLENGSLNVSAKKGNFGMNAFFNGNGHLNATSLNTVNRSSWDTTNGQNTSLMQSGRNSIKRIGFESGLSFDWNLSKKDEISGSFGFDHFTNNTSGITNQKESVYRADNSLISQTLSIRNASSHFLEKSTDLSLDYKRTFSKKDQELDLAVNSSVGKNTSDIAQYQTYQSSGELPSGLKSNNPGTEKQTNFTVDYTQPFSEHFTLETGGKLSIESINNSILTDTLLSNGSYGLNANQSYGFHYKRHIFALYVSGSFSLWNDFIEGKAGLRYENTNTKVDFPGTSIPAYGILSPSIVLQHKFDETQSVKLSYSYRLERPDYEDLNPFFNISDPHNISTGNPNLKPELGHNYELGYNKNFSGGANIYLSGIYRYNTDDIQGFTSFFPTLNIDGTTYSNVSLSQRKNIGSETTEGGNIYVSIPVTGKFSLRSNMLFADRITHNPGFASVEGFMSRLNLNASYDFGHDLAAEIFGSYRSRQRTIQGKTPAFGFYTVAMRKQFLHKKASLGLTVSSPLNKYVNQKSSTSGIDFNQTTIRQIPFRSFGISFSYKFGKMDQKKQDNENGDQTMPSADNS